MEEKYFNFVSGQVVMEERYFSTPDGNIKDIVVGPYHYQAMHSRTGKLLSMKLEVEGEVFLNSAHKMHKDPVLSELNFIHFFMATFEHDFNYFSQIKMSHQTANNLAKIPTWLTKKDNTARALGNISVTLAPEDTDLQNYRLSVGAQVIRTGKPDGVIMKVIPITKQEVGWVAGSPISRGELLPKDVERREVSIAVANILAQWAIENPYEGGAWGQGQ